MTWLRSAFVRFGSLFRKEQLDHELDDELASHISLHIEDNLRAGMTPGEARRDALMKLGGLEQTKESYRESRGLPFLEALSQDLRFALRMLRKSPGFAVIAVLTLALGIGANTVIFSVVNAVLLRPLPYPEPDRLIAVWSQSATRGHEPMHVSAADFYDWRTQSHGFPSLSAYASWPMNLTNVDEPRRLQTQLVSVNLFSTLGVNAQIGRTFRSDEDREQSAPVIVISHHLWQEIGESPKVVGSQLTINGSSTTVIGVMPASFAFPSKETDAWVPLSMNQKNRANREGRWLAVIGRLAPKINQSTAQTEIGVICASLAAAYPSTNGGWSASLVPLREEVVGKTRPILLMIHAGGLLLLFITCANLANLLLARGISRGHEFAVRAAIGAGRTRILRQLMTESLVLVTLGASIGLALAVEGIALLRLYGGDFIPRASEIHLNGPVALFAVIATVITALISGLGPALNRSRVDLRAHISSVVHGTAHNIERKRGLLVAIEIGMACVLLVSAGLLGKSLLRLLMTSSGLRTDHVLTLQLTLPQSKYPTSAAQINFFQQILERVKGLPGVLETAEISDTPLKGNNPTFEFVVDGPACSPSDTSTRAGLRVISPGYLQTSGMPLHKGRDFTVDDRDGSMPVAMLNETMARRYWPGLDAVGRTVRLKEDQRWLTVVGVVSDVKHMGPKLDEGPVVYIPYAQKTQDWLAWTTLVVRTADEPLNLVPAIRNSIRSLDKNQPVAEIDTLEESQSRSTAVPRFTTLVIGVVSGFSVLIAVVGVYGLLAHAVAQRMPELGIRLALGASPLQVFWLVMRQAMVRVIAGIACGLLGAWWLARWLESLLFSVRPHDPAVFTGTAGILVLASMVAVIVPARRAMRIDPANALRWE